MNLERAYNLINYIISKENSGGAFPLNRYNDLLVLANYDHFNSELKKIDGINDLSPIEDVVISITPLRPFVKTSVLTKNALTGFATLPTDYVRWMSLSCEYLSYLYTGGTNPVSSARRGVRNVKMLSFDNYIRSQSDVATRADINPFGAFANAGLFITPYDAYNVVLWYLRKPVSPYFDYCQNPTTMLPIYMPAGSHVSFLNIAPGDDGGGGGDPIDVPIPEYPSLYDANNTLLVANVYKQQVVSPTSIYNSQTVELEWDENQHNMIIGRILSYVGINLSEPVITQYAMTMDGKGNTQGTNAE